MKDKEKKAEAGRGCSARMEGLPAEEVFEEYVTPGRAEAVQLFEFVRNSAHVQENMLYAEMLGGAQFRYEPEDGTLNAFATMEPAALADGREALVPVVVLLGGAARFGRVAALVVAASRRGYEGVGPRFLEFLRREPLGCVGTGWSARVIQEIGLYPAMGDDRTLALAKSVSAGLLLGILAHEAGHLALGHVLRTEYRGNNDISRNQEREADSFASSVIASSPFGEYILAGMLFWHYALAQQEEEGARATTHPLSRERFENFVRANPDLAAEFGLGPEAGGGDVPSLPDGAPGGGRLLPEAEEPAEEPPEEIAEGTAPADSGGEWSRWLAGTWRKKLQRRAGAAGTVSGHALAAMGAERTPLGRRMAKAKPVDGIDWTGAVRRARKAGALRDGGDGGGALVPASRNAKWQEMLRALFGEVPEGAEEAPPCDCTLWVWEEPCDYGGMAGLPPKVDLTGGFPYGVRDQGKRGSCFAFALTALCEYMFAKGGKVEPLSEQSLFYFTKMVTPGKVDDVCDGAIPLDSIHAVEEYGIAPQSVWHYNPESWNHVEDPGLEGQGRALKNVLEAAEQYRWRHWRVLSEQSVLQFKKAIAAGFPVYTGVAVTNGWRSESVERTGDVPWMPHVWGIRVSRPDTAVMEQILSRMLDKLPDDPRMLEAAAEQLAGQLMQRTIEYVQTAVFGAPLLLVEEPKEVEDGVVLRTFLKDFDGGHALCFAGYVDDASYPGGGYFLARNSWGTEWAPESPDGAGYARIPYAYMAMLGHLGYTMTEVPGSEDACGQGGGQAAAPVPGAVAAAAMAAAAGKAGGLPRPMAGWRTGAMRMGAVPSCGTPASSAGGGAFEAWLAARRGVLAGPDEVEGVWCRPGTRVLYPEGPGIGAPWADTPANVARMKALWKQERDSDSATSLAEELFGAESAARKAFATARGEAQGFMAMARERLASLGKAEEVRDLSEPWLEKALEGLALPDGVTPGGAWTKAALDANRAVLYRVVPGGKGEPERWVLAAALCPFAKGTAGSLEARAVSADDLNALQACAEAAEAASGMAAPRPFFYLLESRLGWSDATVARLAGSGQPLILAWPGQVGWNAALPCDGQLDPGTASALDRLLPVAPQAVVGAVRGALDEAFAEGEYAVPLPAVRTRAAARLPALSALPPRFVRSAVLELQKEEPAHYWFVRGFGGQEEVRAHCKDMERITV